MAVETIQRKSGKSYRVYVWTKDRRRITKTFRKLGEAREWERQMGANPTQATAFSNSHARRKTLAELIDAYMLEYTGRDRSIQDRLAWWKSNYGLYKLAAITKPVVNDALRELANGKVQRHRRGSDEPFTLERTRSAATVNRYQQALSSVLSWGIEQDWITDNAAKQAKRRSEPSGRVRYLSDDEREALLEGCDNSKWEGLGLLVRLALSTGARQGELMGLRWSDINLQEKTATLHTTKNKERRVLPLVPKVHDALEAWGRVRRIDSSYVFPSLVKGRDAPCHMRPYWEKAVKDAGLVDFRFHDLHHSCASYLAMSGATPLQIAEILGHKTLAMVKRYSHLNHRHNATLLESVTGNMV